MVFATDDGDIGHLDDKTKEMLELLPGKFWKIGVDDETGQSVFRQILGAPPANLELYVYCVAKPGSEGWYFAKTLNPKER
jgi:hypothetical protein